MMSWSCKKKLSIHSLLLLMYNSSCHFTFLDLHHKFNFVMLKYQNASLSIIE